ERFPEFYEACIRHKMKIMKLQFVHDEKRPYASRIVARLRIGPMKKLKVLKPLIVRNGGFEY
ncbi:MAG: hypothetical protein IKE38_05910, partial [Erysipelotrichaceae bacterium]|nr:hypothetical protein [Erysipelotrichaceae bacterium]